MVEVLNDRDGCGTVIMDTLDSGAEVETLEMTLGRGTEFRNYGGADMESHPGRMDMQLHWRRH